MSASRGALHAQYFVITVCAPVSHFVPCATDKNGTPEHLSTASGMSQSRFFFESQAHLDERSTQHLHKMFV